MNPAPGPEQMNSARIARMHAQRIPVTRPPVDGCFCDFFSAPLGVGRLRSPARARTQPAGQEAESV